MKLDQIAYVTEIAKTGSFSQAARNLYVSQPNLSYSIKQLEQEMGFDIFERNNSGVVITSRGKELLFHYQIIMQEYRSLNALKNLTESPFRLSLRVATLNTPRLASNILSIIKRYQNSPINFNLINCSSFDYLIQQIANYKIDFAIMGVVDSKIRSIKLILKNNDIEYHPLKKSPICVVVGKESPLYNRRKSVSIEELFPHTIISYDDIYADVSSNFPYLLGIEDKINGHIHVNNNQIFYQAIQETSVIGLIAAELESSIQNTWNGIRLLKLEGCDIVMEFGWIKLRRMPLSSIMSELLEIYEKSQ